MFGRRRISEGPSLFMLRIDRPIARISSSCVAPGPSQWFFSLWRRDRNRMDSCRVSTLDVPESPFVSGARGPWQQQRCDTLHCHEQRGSVPPSASLSPWKHSCVLWPRATSILIQEHCYSFVSLVFGRLHYPCESQRSTHCSRLTVLAPLAALTHLTVHVHVHKAGSSWTHHCHTTAVLPLIFI